MVSAPARRIAMSPQGRTAAAAFVLARSPLARRLARRALLGSAPWSRGPAPWARGGPGWARGTGKAAARPARRSPVRPILMGLTAAGATALAVRELPSLRREIKMWLM